MGLDRLISRRRQQLQSRQPSAAVIVASLLGLVVPWASGLLAWIVLGAWHESQQRQPG